MDKSEQSSRQMRMGAYIFINVGSGDIDQLRSDLLEVEEIHLVHLLIGPTDMIAYVEAGSLSQLRSVLDNDIRGFIDKGRISSTATELILQKDGGVGFIKETFIPPLGSAWILVTMSIGDPDKIIHKLLSIDGVINAHAVLGKSDIIVYVETGRLENLVELIDIKIGSIEEIVNTDTRLVLMQQPPYKIREIKGKNINES